MKKWLLIEVGLLLPFVLMLNKQPPLDVKYSVHLLACSGCTDKHSLLITCLLNDWCGTFPKNVAVLL